MARYATHTEVSADRSRTEIERVLTRYGATKFMYGWQEEAAMIAFELRGRQIKFLLPLPRKDDPQFARTPGRRLLRSPEQRLQAWEQATRQRWRALALIIKAKWSVSQITVGFQCQKVRQLAVISPELLVLGSEQPAWLQGG